MWGVIKQPSEKSVWLSLWQCEDEGKAAAACLEQATWLEPVPSYVPLTRTAALLGVQLLKKTVVKKEKNPDNVVWHCVSQSWAWAFTEELQISASLLAKAQCCLPPKPDRKAERWKIKLKSTSKEILSSLLEMSELTLKKKKKWISSETLTVFQISR